MEVKWRIERSRILYINYGRFHHVHVLCSIGWLLLYYLGKSKTIFCSMAPPGDSIAIKVSASGMMRIYIDGQLAVSRQGHPPERLPRKRLYVGQSSASQAGHS